MIGLVFLGITGVLAAAFTGWMGWGRRDRWEVVSGWERLGSETRAQIESSARAYGQQASMPEIVWHGHATIEISWGRKRILFDPVASLRISAAPRWFCHPILDTNRSCDIICLSHAHMDHLDNPTLGKIAATRLYLPRGTERFLSRTVVERHEVRPLDPGEVVAAGDDIEVIPVPARHGGWRYPWQHGLFACGFVIRKNETTVYVSGDSAAGSHFAAIGRRYSPCLAVLPIGAYSPQWFLRKRHLNPEEAVEAALHLGVDYVVPCHFGTYRLSLEPMDEPLRRFAGSAAAAGLRFFLPLPPDGG